MRMRTCLNNLRVQGKSILSKMIIMNMGGNKWSGTNYNTNKMFNLHCFQNSLTAEQENVNDYDRLYYQNQLIADY